MIYRTDYHVHSTFSDGKAAPEEYLPAAKAAGISEIGFSEHLSLFSETQEWCMNPSNVISYIDYIGKLKEQTKDLIIRTSLEIDFIPGKEKEIASFIEPFNLDYRIGSVHYLGERSVDLGPEFYEGKDINFLYESYFEMVNLAVSSGLFDIIGHCDLIRIYGYKPSEDPSPLYRKLASTMKKHNVAFELNTNGRNRPIADFYPDRRFLHIFSEENVAVCVNSDAHMPERIGQYFDEAYNLLISSGFKEMAVFEDGKMIMKPLI